jgi:parallel beta-helix repeat protein
MFAFNVEPIKAQSGEIIINPNGSISSPVPANITISNNETYTFTGNNYLPIVVQRSNIIINGMGHTLQAVGENGFSISDVSNVTIKNTTITNGEDGIWLSSSFGNTLSGNNVTANSQYGIALWSCSNNTVVDNIATSNYWHGILLVYCLNSTVVGNTATSNGYYGICLDYGANDNTVVGNTATSNYCGIGLLGSNNMVVGNTATSNYYGIAVDDSSNNMVVGNTVASNEGGGISIFPEIEQPGNIVVSSSFNNKIIANTIADNGRGIWLWSALNNTVYHNSFIDNDAQVSIDSASSANVWSNGYPSGGNYWSYYQTRYPNATEIDSSGIWNRPYVIDSNNTDYYPLMKPYSALEFSVSISPSSATLDAGQVMLFNSSIFLGTAPYKYQWYLNGAPITGATHSTWDFSEPVGSYNVYLNVTDITGATAKSNLAQVVVIKLTAPLVGGVSASATTFSFLAPWLSIVSLLAAAVLLKGFITKKERRKAKA